jgi:5'-3' exonuclease
LNIKHGGLEDVLEMCKSPLCSETGYTIKWDSICEVLNDLANKEDDEFLKRDERYWATKPPITTDINVIWDNYPVVNKNYKLKHISPGKPGWVPRYYESLFMVKDISSIVKSYVTGLQWTLDYYTGKYSKHTPCWQYVHAYAPTAIDVYNFVACNPDTISGIVNEELQKLRIYEYDPDVALLMVTPPSSFEILNPKLRSFATDINFGIAHCFPDDFRVHTYLKRWAHECKAIIPPVDLEKFRKIVI